MKAKHALIHDTFTLVRRYPSAPAKVYRYFSEPEYRTSAGSILPKTGASVPTASTSAWEATSWRKGAPPGGPLITYDSRILDIVPGERIINSYVLAAAGERFSVSLSTVEFLPAGTGTLMRVTEHGAYFDGNPEGPQMRVHGIGKQLDLLGRVLQKDPD